VYYHENIFGIRHYNELMFLRPQSQKFDIVLRQLALPLKLENPKAAANRWMNDSCLRGGRTWAHYL
jgi:hypothetical protein